MTKSRHVIKKMAAVHNVITESTVREGTESVVMVTSIRFVPVLIIFNPFSS